MPDDKGTAQPQPNLTEPADGNQPKAQLPREDIMRLPVGYQKIYLRELMPKPAVDALLVRNTMFGARETAGGCGKPISKIVTDDSGSTSGK